MDVEFAPLSGNEFQVEGFNKRFHEGDDVIDFKDSVLASLHKTFEGEMSHKVVRVNHQRGSKVFVFNAGMEKELYNEIMEWMDEVTARELLPLFFEFRNFVSFTPPTLLKG